MTCVRTLVSLRSYDLPVSNDVRRPRTHCRLEGQMHRWLHRPPPRSTGGGNPASLPEKNSHPRGRHGGFLRRTGPLTTPTRWHAPCCYSGIALTLVIVAGAFAGGFEVRVVNYEPRGGGSRSGGRRVLYYVEPMHLAYKSDKPVGCSRLRDAAGTRLRRRRRRTCSYARQDDSVLPRPAVTRVHRGQTWLNPDTGNTLEPVYERRAEAAVPPGAIKISPERQQTICVKFATVEAGGATSIRAGGKVAVDETRVGHMITRIEAESKRCSSTSRATL